MNGKNVFETMLDKLMKNQNPPLLGAILDQFEASEALADFVLLIRDYLPAHEAEIMAENGADARITHFSRLFSKQYFTLAEYDFSEEGYSLFLREIPINLEGIGYEDYEDFADRYSPEWACMLALISYPFYVEASKDGSTERIPILDYVRNLAGPDIDRVPAAGFKPEELHAKLDKTEFEPVALFADWVHSQTGFALMDACYEDNPEGPSWDRKEVEWLSEQWPKMLEFQKKIKDFEIWLQEDIRMNFSKVVNAIMGPAVVKEQLPLFGVEDDS